VIFSETIDFLNILAIFQLAKLSNGVTIENQNVTKQKHHDIGQSLVIKGHVAPCDTSGHII